MAQSKKFYAWIGPSNGYAALYWHACQPGKYDWVGLYANEQKKENDYLDYQWVSNHTSYVTSTIITNGLNARYFTWVGDSSHSSPNVSLDEVNDQGQLVVTPASLIASVSGYYMELMRTSALDISAEVNAAGEEQLQPGCWVTCSPNGYAALHWTAAKSQSDSDWVALYQDINKANNVFIGGAWQWATKSSPYITSQAFVPGIHARYIKKSDSPYVALRRSKPIAKGYFDLENMYVPIPKELMETADADAKRIFNIMVDQLKKAVNGEPSIFSPGIWPFGDNLAYKNLSYGEVRVIGNNLHPSQYYDVIMVYYDTYMMAIQIADDGERNAKRHAFWQISMMQKFGEYFAKEIGIAHERGRPGTKEDNRVDAINNAVALQYAKDHPGVDPATAANQMWSSGLLADYNDKVAPEHTKDEL